MAFLPGKAKAFLFRMWFVRRYELHQDNQQALPESLVRLLKINRERASRWAAGVCLRV